MWMNWNLSMKRNSSLYGIPAVLSVVLLCSGEAHPDASFTTEPYLQNVKTTGMTVMWELNAARTCQIEYGLDSDHDGVSDGFEITFNTNPLDPLDLPALPLGSLTVFVLVSVLSLVAHRVFRAAS